MNVSVERWIGYDEAEAGYPAATNRGDWGGFFVRGMRWPDYIAASDEPLRDHYEALRQAIVARRLKAGGYWHQNTENDGVPVFSDGSVATFSWRGWADVLAAVWSTEEDRDYEYMDFYMP